MKAECLRKGSVIFCDTNLQIQLWQRNIRQQVAVLCQTWETKGNLVQPVWCSCWSVFPSPGELSMVTFVSCGSRCLLQPSCSCRHILLFMKYKQMTSSPVSLEADLAPSLCKQDDQGLAKGLVDAREAFAASLVRSVATFSRLLNAF